MFCTFCYMKRIGFPGPAPAWQAWLLKTVLQMTTARQVLGLSTSGLVCLGMQQLFSPCSPGPWHIPASYRSAYSILLSYKFLGPDVSTSLRPTSSFILYILAHPPYTTVYLKVLVTLTSSHTLRKLLHTTSPWMLPGQRHRHRSCSLLCSKHPEWFIGGAHNPFGDPLIFFSQMKELIDPVSHNLCSAQLLSFLEF